jgi:hypothetical protein
VIAAVAAAVAAASCPIFPPSFSINRPVTDLPVADNSDAIIARLSPDTGIHPDFGTIYGIPFDRVGPKTPRTRVTFDYADESDDVRYPIPRDVHIEGGSDRHALLVDRKRCRLYELYALERRGAGWHAGSGATWDLRSKKLRPKGWTSADAAGLPIFPLLARYGEARKGIIRHALRVTFSETRRAYVYPARHFASDSGDPALPRMGERLRLKKSFDVTQLHGQARVIARTMQTYGLIVADNGSDWYVTGAPSKRWNDDVLHTLEAVRGRSFEVVDASSLR